MTKKLVKAAEKAKPKERTFGVSFSFTENLVDVYTIEAVIAALTEQFGELKSFEFYERGVGF